MNKKTIEKILNLIIKQNFWEPSGDPDPINVQTVLVVYKLLKDLKLKVSGETDLIESLKFYCEDYGIKYDITD